MICSLPQGQITILLFLSIPEQHAGMEMVNEGLFSCSRDIPVAGPADTG